MRCTRLLRLWLALRPLGRGARAARRGRRSGRPARAAAAPARSAAASTSRCRRPSATAASTRPSSACAGRTTPAIAAAAWSTSSRRRAPRSTRARSRTPGWISATRASCRTCSRSSPARRSTSRTTIAPTTTSSRSRRRAASTSAATPPGDRRPIRFDRPGIVRVFCDIHSHMSAFILVFAHRYFAVTDDEGRYRIDNVPPGHLHRGGLERGDAARLARACTVPEGGGEVELSFLFEQR